MNLSDLQIQSAEAKMAVGPEWVHLQHLGQGQSLVGVDCGPLDCRSITPHRYIAEET